MPLYAVFDTGNEFAEPRYSHRRNQKAVQKHGMTEAVPQRSLAGVVKSSLNSQQFCTCPGAAGWIYRTAKTFLRNPANCAALYLGNSNWRGAVILWEGI